MIKLGKLYKEIKIQGQVPPDLVKKKIEELEGEQQDSSDYYIGWFDLNNANNFLTGFEKEKIIDDNDRIGGPNEDHWKLENGTSMRVIGSQAGDDESTRAYFVSIRSTKEKFFEMIDNLSKNQLMILYTELSKVKKI